MTGAAPGAAGEHAVRRWMTGRIAALLDVPTSTVHADAVLSELGLTSVQAVELAGDLESWFGRSVPATLVYDFPTVRDVARAVATLEPVPVRHPQDQVATPLPGEFLQRPLLRLDAELHEHGQADRQHGAE